MKEKFWFKFYLATDGSETNDNIWLFISISKSCFVIKIYLIKYFIQITLWLSRYHSHRIAFYIWNTYKKMYNKLFFKINKNVQ